MRQSCEQAARGTIYIMALANAQLAFARRAGIAQALRSQRVISFEAPFCSISEPDSCAGITGAIAATRGEPLYRGRNSRQLDWSAVFYSSI